MLKIVFRKEDSNIQFSHNSELKHIPRMGEGVNIQARDHENKIVSIMGRVKNVTYFCDTRDCGEMSVSIDVE